MRQYQANKAISFSLTPPALSALAGVLLFCIPVTASAMTPEQAAALTSGQSKLVEDAVSAVEDAVLKKSEPIAPVAAFGKTESATSEVLTQDELRSRFGNQDSPKLKANLLANEVAKQKALEKSVSMDADGITDGYGPPPLLDDILLPKKSLSSKDSDREDLPDGSLDMRRDAQREAALSYGARGGLARRNYEIIQKLHAFAPTLDKVFHFRALLVPAPSGLMIEPPIVSETLDNMVITANGNEAAVADQILNINKSAKIVSAPRDWREYLLQPWTSIVPQPPRILWPQNKVEKERWRDWVEKGWKAGIDQAESMFDANLNRLTADYNGMIRYRTLLAQGMISQPYAMHEDRGVTGTRTIMRVGDRAIRITGPAQFLIGSDTWKPADR